MEKSPDRSLAPIWMLLAAMPVAVAVLWLTRSAVVAGSAIWVPICVAAALLLLAALRAGVRPRGRVIPILLLVLCIATVIVNVQRFVWYENNEGYSLHVRADSLEALLEGDPAAYREEYAVCYRIQALAKRQWVFSPPPPLAILDSCYSATLMGRRGVVLRDLSAREEALVMPGAVEIGRSRDGIVWRALRIADEPATVVLRGPAGLFLLSFEVLKQRLGGDLPPMEMTP